MDDANLYDDIIGDNFLSEGMRRVIIAHRKFLLKSRNGLPSDSILPLFAIKDLVAAVQNVD
jgi:hypothetical protein